MYRLQLYLALLGLLLTHTCLWRFAFSCRSCSRRRIVTAKTCSLNFRRRTATFVSFNTTATRTRTFNTTTGRVCSGGGCCVVPLLGSCRIVCSGGCVLYLSGSASLLVDGLTKLLPLGRDQSKPSHLSDHRCRVVRLLPTEKKCTQVSGCRKIRENL